MSGEERISLVEGAEEVLLRRAESLARKPDEEGEEERLSLLMFRLGEEWYGVRLEDVREIHQECRIASLPCVPEFVLGVVNIRGEIVSVTDLGRLMEAGQTGPRALRPPAIVLRNETSVTAAVVDEIGDIAEVPVESIEPVLSTVDKRRAEFVSGSVACETTVCGLLNVERVLRPVGADADR